MMKKNVKYMRKRFISICMCLFMGVITACAAAEENENGVTAISGQNIDNGDGTDTGADAEYPTADADNPAVMQGINAFAYDMSGYLEADGENYFFSPYSLCTALTILDNAADGETKKQIEGVLDIKNLQDWNEQLSMYMNKEQPAEAFVTNANSLWIDKRYTLSDSGYLPLMESYYNAQIFQADFQHDPDGVKDLINQWVSENTNEMIENFIDTVSPLTIMSIINAVYFYGEWSQPFTAESTREETFYGKSGETTVDMMHNNDLQMPYYEADGLRGLSMPYGDGSKVMNILLPSEDPEQPIEELFANLSEDEKNQFLVKLMDSEASNIRRLQLPKYSMEYSVNGLTDILKEMGIANAFDLELADFPEIGDEIYVNEASHVSKLEVDELGSRAAAVTGFSLLATSAPTTEISIDFIVNQPFIFFIQDKETGIILFMGQVNNL